MNQYEPVIGLEVHVELNTRSKMFCRCSADYFGKAPNTHTCPVCLGLPGALPYINEEAIKDCIKIGLALNCEVSKFSCFERKNYFYPDLPKGYQISQYRWPLCINGWMEVEGKEGKRRIRINRVHQEEDTGKLSHIGGVTNIDFNRSGIPLVEIVTEPDFTDTEQVRDYTKKIQQIVRYLGVSNADMERGDMRLEANVSVRPEGSEGLPNYRIELKNINSFRFMVAAIEYEIKRQIEALEKREKLTQETRGWDEDKKKTYLQRSKEEAHDYRYFSDPDLPELNIKYQISKIKDGIPELPEEKMVRLMEEYGLGKEQARILTESRKVADFFEKEIEGRKGVKGLEVEPKEIANLMIHYRDKIDTLKQGQLREELKEKKSGIIKDVGELERLADEAIAENPKFAEDYRKGKVPALQALIGAVMRKSAGKAQPQKVRQILEEKLK